jgi:hypothetical protein
VHIGFVEDKMALGQVFFEFFGLSSVNINILSGMKSSKITKNNSNNMPTAVMLKIFPIVTLF